ncbi:MAG: hypothetical protein DIU70_009505 [Bacillota bacterium]|nr:MAG: hypothetical protein DIU70_04335 [Bacillota bacterium]
MSRSSVLASPSSLMVSGPAPRRTSLGRQAVKYLEVARITLRSRWAYLGEQLLARVHLVIIMFVFVQLWRTTYAAEGSARVSGFTLPEMIWYLVATEAIILSLPRVHAALQQEVQGGDLAIRLNKPYSYLLFHYAAFVGEGLVLLATALGMGGLTAYLLVGGFDFRWEAVPVLALVYLVTQALHFTYHAAIGLLAFWTEDVMGIFFFLDRVKWILGGMLLPLDLFPPALRQLAEVLPFREMIYGPALLFVRFSWPAAAELLLRQGLWLLALSLVCVALYRLGVRRVDINGG